MTEERLTEWETIFSGKWESIFSELPGSTNLVTMTGYALLAVRGGKELITEVRRLQAENKQLHQIMDGFMDIAAKAIRPRGVTLGDIIRFHDGGRS